MTSPSFTAETVSYIDEQSPTLHHVAQQVPVVDQASNLSRQLVELKSKVEHLQKSETRYRHLLEDLVVPVCCFLPDLTLTFVNHAYSNIWGTDPSAIIGHSLLEVVPVQYHEAILSHVSSLNSVTPVATSTVPLLLANGTERWFEWTSRKITDEAGQIAEYQSIGRDITVERAAVVAEQEQRHLAEGLRDSLAILTGRRNTDDVMQQILATVDMVVPSEAGSILLYEESHLRVAYMRGFTATAATFFKEYRFVNDPNGVFARPEPFTISDTLDWPSWQQLPGTEWIRSSIGVPIMIRGKVIGFLVLDCAVPHRFQPADAEKLHSFAQYASLALEHIEHVDQLELHVAKRTAELQLVNERLETILNRSPDAILLIESDLRIKQTNEPFVKLFGQRLGCSFLELVHDDNVAAVVALLQAVSCQLVSEPIEIRVCGKDGTFSDVDFSAGAIGEMGLVCTIHNISKRKSAQIALAEERNLLRTLIDAIPHAIYTKDLQHRLILCNTALSDLFPASTQEGLLGQTTADVFPPAWADRFVAEEKMIFETGSSLINVEEQMLKYDGSLVWISATRVPLRNINNEVIGLVGIAYDITPHKQAEAARRASEEKFRRLIESMHEGLAIYDKDEQITYANDHFCKMLGYSREELMGTNAKQYIDPSSSAEMDQHLALRQQGKSSTYEITVICKDGQRCHWLVAGSPLFDEQHRWNGSFALLSDISAQKQVEASLREAVAEEKELGGLKSRFVSMASHEFRTPLTSILIITETLRAYRNKLTAEQIEDRLGKIYEQGAYLKSIMEDVLQLARIQAGRAEFDPTPLDLDALCRTIIEEFEQQPTMMQRLLYQCEGERLLIKLDKRLMRQVISNLLMNATKYSSPQTSISTHLMYLEGKIILRVQDEGIGIPAADLPYLFEPFHRATNVGTIAGTGLGLSITKESVEAHGGTVSVVSQIGVGTTFTVTIPLPETDALDSADSLPHTTVQSTM